MVIPFKPVITLIKGAGKTVSRFGDDVSDPVKHLYNRFDDLNLEKNKNIINNTPLSTINKINTNKNSISRRIKESRGIIGNRHNTSLYNNNTVMETLKKKIPFQDYIRLKKETNTIAKHMGFESEDDFAKFIKESSSSSDADTKKLKNIFLLFKEYAQKNPKSIVKYAVITGTISGMVIYLKKFQSENTGCFRYEKNANINNVLIKYKFKGNFCNNVKQEQETNYIKLLPENNHPLYGKLKWDCSFNQFYSNENFATQDIDDIRFLGCNGLCNWENFNRLAQSTKEYAPIEYNINNEEENNQYLYVCESSTILRELATSVGDTVNEVFTGLNRSIIGKQILNMIHKSFYFLLMLFFFNYIYYNYI